ncbi:MAG: hypothetical protein KJ049_06700 [Gammaproteobacteria bacterium]|jgi:hypothetical protein|nr:hypothetical protein [Gammaproteobacteria bacterium]
MSGRIKLLCWEIGCMVWIAMAGSLLHFAFELSEYWRPMAVMAAVNESAWEHTKMYFWPGLFYALVQYTYTRKLANNYWLGKVVALALTPLTILVVYFSYLAYVDAAGAKPSLAAMLTIMIAGISAGQFASWRILCAPPIQGITKVQVASAYAVLLLAFSSLTYFPPRVFVFENFYCYQYTGEYGILDNYEPYRVFYEGERPGAGVNYCATLAQQATSTTNRP